MGVRVAIERGSGATMRSPVNWSLLGLVIQRPSYGYELVQRFERTYGDSLELSSPSQVYTALDSLERRGWIEEMAIEDAGAVVRQPKPHYRATADGMRSYQEWLIDRAHDERRRSRVFARQLAMLPAEDALTVIDRYERACLDEASRTSVGSGSQLAADRSASLLARLELEDDRLSLESRLAWIQYARLQFTGQALPASSKDEEDDE